MPSSRPCQAPAPRLDAGFEQRELVRPGREAAGAAEVVELAENGDEAVIGRLSGQVLVVLRLKVIQLTAATRQLEACRSQQEGVKL